MALHLNTVVICSIALAASVALVCVSRGSHPASGVMRLSKASKHSSSDSNDISSISGCPAWFQDYVAFHQEHRGRADAKYLVAECSVGGLGDRLNGALTVLRTAAAIKRVVLLQMPAPFPLEELFEPPGPVNWTTRGLKLPRNGTR